MLVEPDQHERCLLPLRRPSGKHMRECLVSTHRACLMCHGTQQIMMDHYKQVLSGSHIFFFVVIFFWLGQSLSRSLLKLVCLTIPIAVEPVPLQAAQHQGDRLRLIINPAHPSRSYIEYIFPANPHAGVRSGPMAHCSSRRPKRQSEAKGHAQGVFTTCGWRAEVGKVSWRGCRPGAATPRRH